MRLIYLTRWLWTTVSSAGIEGSCIRVAGLGRAEKQFRKPILRGTKTLDYDKDGQLVQKVTYEASYQEIEQELLDPSWEHNVMEVR